MSKVHAPRGKPVGILEVRVQLGKLRLGWAGSACGPLRLDGNLPSLPEHQALACRPSCTASSLAARLPEVPLVPSTLECCVAGLM